MKLGKIVISKEQFDVNLKFYFILKYLLKAGLSDREVKKILELYSLNRGALFKTALLKNIDTFFRAGKQGTKKQSFLVDILDICEVDFDIELFIFSLKLNIIKPLLLQEAMLTEKIKKCQEVILSYKMVHQSL